MAAVVLGKGRRIWHSSNPGKHDFETADKTWAGYYFCLGACVLSGASLGSPPGVQTSSRRMSRPALRLTCFFSLSAFPKHQPPGGH